MPIEQPLNPFIPDLQNTPIDIEVEEDLGPDEDIFINLDPDMQMPVDVPHNANLAEHMDESDLADLARELTGDFEADRDSREDWERTYIQGLDLLGLKFEDRSEPWDGACGVFHPLLAESVVRFQAQTIQEIFPASGPVKTHIAGNPSSEMLKQARRVQDYMNYVACEEMKEYRRETEKLLFSLPIAGSAFRKVYFDPSLGRMASMFVPAEDFVVSYGASDLHTCERATHIMKRTENEVLKLMDAGFYRSTELVEPSPDISEVKKKYDEMTGNEASYSLDKRHTHLEMQVDLDLPGFEDMRDGVPTGIGLPYVVTVDKSSREVLAIYRNWREEDPRRNRRDHFVEYTYLPGLGFYGFGLVHIIGGLSKSATSLLRQLVDSGTLANLPGGLKSRGLRIKGDDTPITPGEWRDVDVPGGTIKENILPLPYKEPSSVLYQLLADLVAEGRRFASAADVKVADISGETPVGTTLAVLEREMKVLSAVQARVHASMGEELKILARLIKDHGPEQYPFDVGGDFSLKKDFDDRIDIIPVSDPNAGTMAQRIMQYQAALQLSAQAPQMYDMQHLHRQMLEALGIADVDRVVPSADNMLPADPVAENMAILNSKPVKAFLYQDHEAHIQVHMAAMQHPQIQGLLAKSPQAKAVQAAAMAHISEHLGMAYRRQIEEQLGTPLPPPNEPLPEDIELRISRLVAPAAAQVTGKAQQQQQAEKNAQMQQDPIIQMQQKELEIKERQQQAGEREGIGKIIADMQKFFRKQDADDRERERKHDLEQAKLAAKIMEDAEDRESKEKIEGYKMAERIAKDLTDSED